MALPERPAGVSRMSMKQCFVFHTFVPSFHARLCLWTSSTSLHNIQLTDLFVTSTQYWWNSCGRCDRHSMQDTMLIYSSNVLQHPFQTVEGSRLRTVMSTSCLVWSRGLGGFSSLAKHMFHREPLLQRCFILKLQIWMRYDHMLQLAYICASTMYIIIRIAFITYLFIIYSFSIHQRGRTELWSIRIQKWHHKRPCHLSPLSGRDSGWFWDRSEASKAMILWVQPMPNSVLVSY